MSFGREMKDFVAAFKTGSDIADKWNDNERQGEKGRKEKEEADALKAEQDKAERDIGNTASNARAANSSLVEEGLPTDGSPAMDGTTAPSGGLAPTVENANSPQYLAKMTSKESGGNPSIKSKTSTATGLHQFTEGTWADLRKANPDLGLTAGGRTDPEQSERGVRRFTSENASILAKNGFQPTQANKYIMHFMGKGGGPDFLNALKNDPSMNAAGLFPKEAKANRSIFYNKDGAPRSVGDVYNTLTRSFSKRTAQALPIEGNDDGSEPVVYAAEGGLIDPEYMNMNDGGSRMPQRSAVEPAGEDTRPAALPGNSAPAPAKPAPKEALPISEDTSNSNSGGSGGVASQYLNPDLRNEAIDAGMKEIATMLKGKGAIGDADPDRKGVVENFARNADTATPEDMEAADRAIDPKGELAPHLKSMARLNAAYDFYTKRGEPQKAAKVAASMMDYSRKVAMSGGATIQALIERGNLAGAAKTAEKVYDQLPNGNKLEMKPTRDGKAVDYKVLDPDGRLTDGGRLAINEFMRMSTKLQDGSAWFESMGYYGGLHRTQSAGRSDRRGVPGAGRTPAAPRTTLTERKEAEVRKQEEAGQASRDAAFSAKEGEIMSGYTPTDGSPSTLDGTTNQPLDGASRELDRARSSEEILVKADKLYKERIASRKGVRVTESASGRDTNAEGVAKGFTSVTQPGKEDATIDPSRKVVINGIAAKIMKGNDGLTAEDAGRVIGEIIQNGPSLRADGTIGARGGKGASVSLDSAGIKQLVELYGGKLPTVAGVNTRPQPAQAVPVKPKTRDPAISALGDQLLNKPTLEQAGKAETDGYIKRRQEEPRARGGAIFKENDQNVGPVQNNSLGTVDSKLEEAGIDPKTIGAGQKFRATTMGIDRWIAEYKASAARRK